MYFIVQSFKVLNKKSATGSDLWRFYRLEKGKSQVSPCLSAELKRKPPPVIIYRNFSHKQTRFKHDKNEEFLRKNKKI